MTERIIAQRLGIGLPQVQGTVRLLREGATIPFISRYRKEATGSLDEARRLATAAAAASAMARPSGSARTVS